MTDGVLTLHLSDGQPCGTVKVHLKFDVPEEVMNLLVTDISRAVDHWQNRITIKSIK